MRRQKMTAKFQDTDSYTGQEGKEAAGTGGKGTGTNPSANFIRGGTAKYPKKGQSLGAFGTVSGRKLSRGRKSGTGVARRAIYGATAPSKGLPKGRAKSTLKGGF